KWERGMSPVAPLHWTKYAEILNVDPEQFEDTLIETLKSYAIETLNISCFDDAIISGRYDPAKLYDARQSVKKIIASPSITKEDENYITSDLAKKIYNQALKRAKIRRGLLLTRFMEQIRKDYHEFTDEQCLELIRAIPDETISRVFIMAEITRMNASISFLAEKSEEGANA
ncbi:MAG: hypothetical protein J6W70_09325, partial [Lentisphaeria bacterium]|nr:hypothetical protein [Lentisphaeria bacterium]